MSGPRLAPITGALLLAIAGAAACKKAAPATLAPADGGGAMPGADSAAEEPQAEQPAAVQEDLDGLQSELDRLTAELAAAKAGPEGTPEPADPAQRQTRCERICELAAAVCDLEARICALADEHAGEDRYASTCARAGGDCQRATEACDACSG